MRSWRNLDSRAIARFEENPDRLPGVDLVVERDIHVNCGSPDMIEQLGARVSGREITLRINPGFGHGHSQKTNTGGEVLLDLNTKPTNGTSDGKVRFFRETNTTGLKLVQFLRGNNTTQTSAQIGVGAVIFELPPRRHSSLPVSGS